jgi:hypothetical protein
VSDRDERNGQFGSQRATLAARLARRDLAAYEQTPPTDDELALGETEVAFDLADDDVDYEALYGSER